MKYFRLSPFLLLLLLAFSSAAHAVQEMDWDGLVPSLDIADPYEQLTANQKRDAYFLWNARKLKNQGQNNTAVQRLEERYVEKLAASGLDADSLMAQMDHFISFRKANRKKIKASLDGQEIRIAGYVLPIEFSGTRIVEFLLVPGVGDCIHTPPPPPNQLVFVKVEGGIADNGLFAPVRVSGLVSTGHNTQTVTYSDGQLDVNVGYTMDASLVEPYDS